MNPLAEAIDVGLCILLVFIPSYVVDPDRRGLLQVEEGFRQQPTVNVMQQVIEFEPAVLAGSFANAVKST
jgi:hypothetical protein